MEIVNRAGYAYPYGAHCFRLCNCWDSSALRLC